MIVRPAVASDAEAMSNVLKEIIALTGKQRPHDVDFVLANYIRHPQRIESSAAVDEDGSLLGFQSMILATADNPFEVAVGWGIIGTHVSPRAHRRGAGKALFAATKKAAEQAGVKHIDASIGADNELGLAYYEAIGFRTYRTMEGRICKRFDVV